MVLKISRLDKYKKRIANGCNATEIMNDMEKEFYIPMLNDEEYNKKNADVIALYREISDRRDFYQK